MEYFEVVFVPQRIQALLFSEILWRQKVNNFNLCCRRRKCHKPKQLKQATEANVNVHVAHSIKKNVISKKKSGSSHLNPYRDIYLAMY